MVFDVDDIFAIGLKSRCDRLRDGFNHLVPVKNLGELRWFGGCHFSRDREGRTRTSSVQYAFPSMIVDGIDGHRRGKRKEETESVSKHHVHTGCRE